MKFLCNKINILLTNYQSPADFTLSLYTVTIGFKNRYLIKKEGRFQSSKLQQIECLPTLLLLTGYGVLHKTREENPEMIERIISGSNTFFYKEKSGEISLIRKDQLMHATGLFEKNKIEPCDIDFIKSEPSQEDIQLYANDFIKRNITLKALVYPGKSNSLIAQHIYKRIRYYLLTVAFILLTANTFIKYKLEQTCNKQTVELIAIQKQNSKLNSVSMEKKQVLKIFQGNLPWQYSMLCDYLAALVPSEIILQRIGVQPLSKNLANGELPKIIPNTILITGCTSQTETITDFIQKIEKEPYSKKIQLKQMRQNKEDGTFTFMIEILL